MGASKSKGSMGFRDMKSFNKTLLEKQIGESFGTLRLSLRRS
jgi:hypothetical protein